MLESTKYSFYGAAFGLCFPVGSFVFLALIGEVSLAHGILAAIRYSHAVNPLLYVIDTAPLFLGLFARFAGIRQDRIRRFSESLEQEVAEKTESLRRALEDAQKANETIIHMAEHDTLTGLLNRRCFQKGLEQWVSHCARYSREVALLFIDLDKFKNINDAFGHAFGDSYLQAVADVLQRALRSTDYITRWGGDEFAVLLPETSAEAAAQVANKLLRLFDQTTVTEAGQTMSISASIGISLMPQHALASNELMMCADAAMYEAKQFGRNCWRMYSATSRENPQVQEKFRWERRIRRALETDQFVLLYQPLLGLSDSSTHHYEALLRMEDRDGRLITPGMFLESAEQFDLSVPIDRMVIRKVAHKISTLVDQDPGLCISVNLSRKTLMDPGLVEQAGIFAAQVGAQSWRLGFEIPERVVMENLSMVRNFADEARQAGHPFIMDDFGTGLASFRYLQQLSLGMVKFESSLLNNIMGNPESRRVLKTLTAMAHDLGIKVAAKFVEDPQVLQVLADLGVDYAQGFAVGRPLEAIEQAALQARRIA